MKMSPKLRVLCIVLAVLMTGWTVFVVLDSLVFESASSEQPILGPTVSQDLEVSKEPVSVDWDDPSSSAASSESGESGETDPSDTETSAPGDDPDPVSDLPESSGAETSKGETSQAETSKGETSKSNTSKSETSKSSDTTSRETGEPGSWSLPEGTSKVIGQYRDDDIAIRITQYREYRSDIYVADIVLSSPTYFKTALAKDTYGKNIRESPSVTAKNANAILAVNGDYYSARQSGYVIRNGILYRQEKRDNRRCLAIYDDGRFEIVSEEKVSALTLLNNRAVHVLSFGPSVIENGVVTAGDKSEILDTTVPHNNPRTVIAQVSGLHYIFCVVDGRTDVSKGMKLADMGEFLLRFGVTQAYNLDGGGTSWMYFQGKVINHPCSDGTYITERSVSDIVCITKG